MVIEECRVLRFLPNIHVHWSIDDRIWASRGHDIITSSDAGVTWSKVTTVPGGYTKALLSRVESFRRLFRLGVRAYVQLNEDEFIVFVNGNIFWWRKDPYGFVPVGRVRHGSGPLANGCCVDDRGHCYYGEYWRNGTREEVSVLSWRRGAERWEPFYTFSAGTIRHIHAVQFDAVSRKLWVATGDHDHESQIGYFDGSGLKQRLTIVAAGQQMARAVSLLFTTDYVYWGSDGNGGVGDGANHIYRWCRATSTIQPVARVKGPVYYSIKCRDERLYVATVVEGDTSEPDQSAHLWMSVDGSKWKEIGKWKKDRWPFVFGHGILSFPGGHPTQKLYVTSHALEKSFGTWVLEPAQN